MMGSKTDGPYGYWHMTLRALFVALWRWLKSHEPVFCRACNRLIFKQDATYEQVSWGEWVALCPKCHKEIFNPFSESEE
jgi:hypothetical protein